MPDESKTDADIILSQINKLASFINASVTLRESLLELKKAVEPPERFPPHIILGPRVWCAIARWWRYYTSAWEGFGEIEPILKKRWMNAQSENAQKWIDETRGAMFHLSVPFFIDRVLEGPLRERLDADFNKLEILDKEMNEADQKWAHALQLARKTYGDREIPMVDNPEWNAADKEHHDFIMKYSQKVGEWADVLDKRNIYVWKFYSFIHQTRWEERFEYLLTRVEERTATLSAAHSGNNSVAAQPSWGSEGRKVVLQGSDLPVLVNGKQKLLTSKQYKVIEGLANAPFGLTGKELIKFGKDARGTLRRFRDTDEDWGKVIRMAETSGGRYRLE